MVVVIVLIGTGAGLIKFYIKHRENFSEKDSQVDAKVLLAKIDEQYKTIQALEKRIQNLETVITSNEYNLNQKFKEL